VRFALCEASFKRLIWRAVESGELSTKASSVASDLNSCPTRNNDVSTALEVQSNFVLAAMLKSVSLRKTSANFTDSGLKGVAIRDSF